MTKPLIYSDKRLGITQKPLIYLASPYSDPDPKVMARRAACVAAVTARLLKEGKHVFSPIAYSHQFAVEHGMGTDWESWDSFCSHMLWKCGEISILDIPGWKTSRGINGELSTARDHDIPRGDLIKPTPEELAILDEPEEEWTFDPSGLTLGLYRVHWKSGGTSLASIGLDRLGDYWMAPSNWVIASTKDWDRVLSVDFIDPDNPKKEPEPITQPETKCKFWSDEDGCEHPKWVRLGCPMCPSADGSSCNEYEPTAEEKITEGLEGFADELEAGRVVAHPCMFFDSSADHSTDCVADWTCMDIDTPSPCAWFGGIDGVIASSEQMIKCTRFKPREIPPPEEQTNLDCVHWKSVGGCRVCTCKNYSTLAACGYSITGRDQSLCKNYTPTIPTPEDNPEDDATQIMESLMKETRKHLDQYQSSMRALLRLVMEERKKS